MGIGVGRAVPQVAVKDVQVAGQQGRGGKARFRRQTLDFAVNDFVDAEAGLFGGPAQLRGGGVILERVVNQRSGGREPLRRSTDPKRRE